MSDAAPNWNPSAHSLRVQAWVYDVVNPLIGALGREVAILEKGRIPWISARSTFEHIGQFAELVPYGAQPNVDDFASREPRFDALRARHDRAVTALASACERASEALRGDRALIELLHERHDADGDRDVIRGEAGMPRWAIDYIVGGVRELGPDFTTARFWNRHGAELMERAAAHREVAKDAAEALAQVARETVDALRDLRTEYCDRFDIPAAPLVSR